MPFDLHRFVSSVWLLTGLYWLVLSFSSKRTARREPIHSRLLHLMLMAIAFSLLGRLGPSEGWLARRILPGEDWIVWTGAVLSTLGCAFAVWARSTIGSNWSAIVSVRENHELIRRGPYSIVRHPIYSGLLLASLCVAIMGGEIRQFVGVCLLFAGWLAKAATEERAMSQQFGAEYLRYASQVKRFVPFVL
jgi:protein-S-isoprenylcysteine O-methyltransferase Ste14